MDERRRVWNSTFRRPRKPMNKTSDRRDREWARAYGSEERVLYVRRLPCLVMDCVRGPCDNAHTTTGGTGRKSDAEHIVPLCRVHHTDGPESLHALGRHVFERVHGLDLAHEATLVDEAWRNGLDPDPVEEQDPEQRARDVSMWGREP